MSIFYLYLLEALTLGVALSVDTFVASFAYGSNKIKIPFMSAVIINIISSLILAVFLILGSFLRPHIPSGMTNIICFSILFVLGITKLFDSSIKSLIRKENGFRKQIHFSLFNIKFILNVYANPENADSDLSRILSPIEAISLAVALSLDSIAVGIGAAIADTSFVFLIAFSLIANVTAIILGSYTGNKCAKKLHHDISWVGGLLLVILAIMKLCT